ncbi:MAG: hypothetical protein E7549_08265 [Ruminococcaceae bacterium]|nr:hypothetical protein [Oscillospiraceae bacterium]
MKEKAMTPAGNGAAVRSIAVALFWAVMGILTPRVSVYGGLSPFGVGLAASAGGAGALLTYAAVSVGYVLGGDVLFLFRYLAAVTVAAGIRWSFSGLKGPTAARLMPPIAGFVAALTAGLAVQTAGGISIYTASALVCEGAIAGGFAHLCAVVDRLLCNAETTEKGLIPSEQVAVCAVAAVAVMSLVTVAPGGISLGRVLAAVAVLLFARSGKEQGGGIAGVALGTALWLTSPEDGAVAVALAFGGLAAGVMARINRFAASGIFLIASTLVVMASGDGAVVARTVYETAVGSVLFLLLPTSLDRRINGFFLRGREMPAVEGLRRSVVWRLDYAARAMNEVAGTVDTVSRRMAAISAPDVGTLCREVSEDICRRCARNAACWQSGFDNTMASFNALTAVLREEGKISREQLKGALKDCPQAGVITDRINEGYGRFVMRETAFRRLSEIRAVAGDQFYAMASMLGELSAVFADAVTVDEVAGARVREVCDRFSLPLTEVLCTVGAGRRMTVDMMLSDTAFSIDEAMWRQQLNEACGRVFQPPQITRMGTAARVLLRERPRYKVAVGQAQLTCSGERLCGDAAEVFTDAEGRTVMVLSDGMGCGGRAAVDGAMTAGLTARLLQAGFGADSVLRMVNAALMVKGGSESLATLDVAVIDPFTGKTSFLKAGAATSLLLSGGRVSRVEPSSLPLGILREVTFARSEDQLASGDVLLLFSDGAVSESIAAAEEILRDYDAEKGSMQNLAEKVASAARRLQQAKDGHEDDITVLAARVYVGE